MGTDLGKPEFGVFRDRKHVFSGRNLSSQSSVSDFSGLPKQKQHTDLGKPEFGVFRDRKKVFRDGIRRRKAPFRTSRVFQSKNNTRISGSRNSACFVIAKTFFGAESVVAKLRFGLLGSSKAKTTHGSREAGIRRVS